VTGALARLTSVIFIAGSGLRRAAKQSSSSTDLSLASSTLLLSFLVDFESDDVLKQKTETFYEIIYTS